MSISNSILADKSKAFAVRIAKMYKYLTTKKQERIMSSQLLRSGTSVGANIREALYAQSKNDFIAKMYIAYKENAETAYWLEVLHEAEYITDEQFNSIYSDCTEIGKMLTSTLKASK